MDPVDFLKTAESLKDSPREPDIRTSIGRSYYGVFLYFRERLASKGLSKKRFPTRQAHKFILDCLANCDEKLGKRSGAKLRDLMQRRHNADYKLQIPFSQNDSNDALVLAEHIIRDFDKITVNEESNLIKNAIAHARKEGWI